MNAMTEKPVTSSTKRIGSDLRVIASAKNLAGIAMVLMVVICSFATASLTPRGDGGGCCAADSVEPPQTASVSSLMIQDILQPNASAGSDREVYVGAITILNGSGSDDDIGVANYTWTFFDEGLQTLYGAVVAYEFSTPGVYNITLNVSDAEGNWDVDNILVTVIADTVPPFAKATNRTVFVGTLVDLNATGSRDNAQIVNYTWIFEYNHEIITLYGVVAPFWFNKSGTHLVNLTVTDASGNTNSTTVLVQVNNIPTWLSENWLRLFITVGAATMAAYWLIGRYRRNHALWTSSDMEKLLLQWKNFKKTWRIFRANRIGMTGFIALIIFVGVAIFAPTLSTVQNPDDTDNYEPTIIVDGDPISMNPLPPSLTPSPYTDITHLLGTDHKGQDIYSMTLYGARASLYVGLVATAISALMGAAIGLAAGYFGKIADEALMRATDFFLVLPWFPLMIVMMAILGREFIYIIVVIGITSWPSTARIVRSQVLTVKERQFIERARAIGAGDGHIISKHIMPNVMPLIFANTVLLISLAIFSESFLDFFGLGDPTVISWGTMLEGAYAYGAFYKGAWWYILPPGLCILGMVLSFSLVGYALDDVLNPKLRRR